MGYQRHRRSRFSPLLMALAAAALPLGSRAASSRAAVPCSASSVCSAQQEGAPAPPIITSFTCSDTAVTVGKSVTCTADISDDAVSIGWSASGAGASPDGKNGGKEFTTTFGKTGDGVIGLLACSVSNFPQLADPGSCVNPDSIKVTVSLPAPPTIESFGCSAASVPVGTAVRCQAQVTTDAVNFNWNASGAGASPDGSSGGATFATTLTKAGDSFISLQVCSTPFSLASPPDLSTCTDKSTKLTATAAAPIPAAAGPATLKGKITVSEQDIGCGFSAMPSTTGDLTITVTPDASPSAPMSASGTLHGAGSGSRTVSCSTDSGKGFALQTWHADYSGNFSGSVAAGGAVTLSGKVNITQSASYSNCRDLQGGSLPCPAPAGAQTYTLHITGTVNVSAGSATGGSGAIGIDSGCTTAGTWTASALAAAPDDGRRG